MQTKQHAPKKKQIHIQIEARFTRNCFCGERIFSRECSKSSVFNMSYGATVRASPANRNLIKFKT